MYSALELSKYIVTKCINDGKPISNLQLQKILYYIQRDFLKQGEPASVSYTHLDVYKRQVLR